MIIRFIIAIVVIANIINVATAATPVISNLDSSYQEISLDIDTSQITSEFKTLVSDVNDDGVEDIVLVTESQNTYVYLGDTNGAYTLNSTHVGNADIFNSVSFKIASLLPNRTHLVYSTPASATNAGVFVIDLTANLAASNDLFANPVQIEHAFSNSVVHIADMNNDNLLDIITVASGTVMVVHINQNDGTFIFPGSEQSKYSTPSANPVRLNKAMFVDANSDGFVDIYGFEQGQTSLYLLQNDADTTHGFIPNPSGEP